MRKQWYGHGGAICGGRISKRHFITCTTTRMDLYGSTSNQSPIFSAVLLFSFFSRKSFWYSLGVVLHLRYTLRSVLSTASSAYLLSIHSRKTHMISLLSVKVFRRNGSRTFVMQSTDFYSPSPASVENLCRVLLLGPNLSQGNRRWNQFRSSCVLPINFAYSTWSSRDGMCQLLQTRYLA